MHVFDWADKFVWMYIIIYCTTIHIHKVGKKEEKNGLPVVELDVTVGNVVFKNVKFQLTKENVVKINQNTLNRKNSIIVENKIPLIEQSKKQNLIKEQNLSKKKIENPVKTELKKLVQKESKSGLIKQLIKENTEELFKELLLTDNGDKQIQKFFELIYFLSGM